MSRLITKLIHRPRNILWLILAISGLSALAWLINSESPHNKIALVGFFSLVFVVSASVSMYLTNIVRHGLLIGSGVLVFFLLRFLGLRDWYYVILLALCIVSLEMYQQKK